MRAAILVRQGEPLVVDDVDLPERLEHGQVLVRVRYSGICGSQLGEIDGVKGEDRYLPHLLGHEGSGVVSEVGPGVRSVRPGDHVVLHWRKGRGLEAEPPRYAWRGRPLNAGWVTTFNEVAVVAENRVTAIPPDFPLDLAPLFGCAVTTGFGIVSNDAGLKIGESIVVFGAGGVGLSVVQGAALSSAHPVVAVDLVDSRLELARTLGATHAVNAAREEARTAVLRILEGEGAGQGADAVVENTGNPRVIELAYELAAPAGRVVLVGVPKKGERAALYTLPLHFGKRLRGSHGGDAEPAEDIPRYLRLYAAGKLRLSELVTERFPLDEINTAVDRMRSGAVTGRCLIEMSR